MKFWVDMDNAPHVHVLRPIIAELERRGHSVEITARDYGQTLPLLDLFGLTARKIGHHAGRNPVRKHISFATRSLSLILFARGKRFDAAICHGSRSMVPAARFFGLPLINMGDYEHASFPNFMIPWIRLQLVPDVIPVEVFSRKGMISNRVCGYPGLKEDLYVHDFVPDPSFLREMVVDLSRVVILVRPPATMAHYAVKASAMVFDEVLEYLCSRADVQLIVLPRTEQQSVELKGHIRERGYTNVIFPDATYNGPNLVWHCDLVISGGGTMNREAAALGVPVYSIYQGPIGAVDRNLIETGRLVHVKDLNELKRIPLEKSTPRTRRARTNAATLARDFIISRILEAAGDNQEVAPA